MINIPDDPSRRFSRRDEIVAFFLKTQQIGDPSGETLAHMQISESPDGEPYAATCGNCGTQFPIDIATEENLVLMRFYGEKQLVEKCPNCGAVGRR